MNSKASNYMQQALSSQAKLSKRTEGLCLDLRWMKSTWRSGSTESLIGDKTTLGFATQTLKK